MEMPPGECGGRCSSFDYRMHAMPMMRGMQMSFYWGKPMTLLFSGWPDGSLGMYWLALFFVFFLAMAVEALSVLTSAAKRANSIPLMSFNGGVFVAAVVGHGVGHFVADRVRRSLMKGKVLTATNGGDHA
uniref:Copper transport protein n=1 Tax=Kalanchoe fedtschenkoi TaxID=63787 RepID=A0A7N0UAA8_KALFE